MKPENRTISYKGYLIKRGLLGEYFVGKDGVWVYCTKSLDRAKQSIDELQEG
jgi:hypothetical protein